MPPDAELAPTIHEGSLPSASEDAEKPAPSTAMEIEEPCPICLHPISGDAFLDPCFHRFCYHCIFQWSEMVFTHPSMEGETCLECPLCKTRSSCIVHSFFLDTFQRHYFFGIPPSKIPSFSLSPAHYQRLYVYKNGLRTSVTQTLNQNINCRRRVFYISGNKNVQQWMQRELQALMQVEDVDLIMQHVLGILKHFVDKQRVDSHIPALWMEAVCGAVEPFLFENGEAFCSELHAFLSSGLNVKAYDLLVEEVLKANTLKVGLFNSRLQMTSPVSMDAHFESVPFGFASRVQHNNSRYIGSASFFSQTKHLEAHRKCNVFFADYLSSGPLVLFADVFC